MTTIYLMRHGETDWNRQERMQGQMDCPLNENGRRQAAEAGKKLTDLGIRFDRVCSSPLCRALETAQIISGRPEQEIITDPDIMEMGFGPFEGVFFVDMPAEMFTFFSDPERFPAPEGMETIPHLKKRTGRFLDRLRTADPGGTMLVVAHGVALRVLLGFLEVLVAHRGFFLVPILRRFVLGFRDLLVALFDEACDLRRFLHDAVAVDVADLRLAAAGHQERRCKGTSDERGRFLRQFHSDRFSSFYLKKFVFKRFYRFQHPPLPWAQADQRRVRL